MTPSAPLVLVVEDDEDVASVVSDVVEIAGYRSAVASNGREALAAMRRERPSLVLLDLMMPEMDGWQFREEQRRHPGLASVPVLIMTADGRADQKAESLGAAGFVRKPTSIDELIAELERLLGPSS
jgi:CheY-like chemotaxis protein